MLASIALSLALAISADAAATTQAKPAPAPEAAKTASTAGQIICKRESDTGSRLGGHKVCHTKAQWDQLSADSGKALQEQQMQAYSGSPR